MVQTVPPPPDENRADLVGGAKCGGFPGPGRSSRNFYLTLVTIGAEIGPPSALVSTQ